MVVRMWHGWASAANADKYQEHFQGMVLDNLRKVEGFRAAQLWRHDLPGSVEFVAVTTWDSTDAVRAFAGPDYERAVVEPEARRILTQFDERVSHYEIVASASGQMRR